MLIDAQTLLSQAQAVTASAPSTNYIDLGAPRDIGMSGKLALMINVNSAAVGAGASVTFQIQGATDAAFTTPVVDTQSGAFTVSQLVAGFQTFMKIDPGTNLRYLRLYYSVTNGPLTAGTFTAAIVSGIQKAQTYPKSPNA